MQCTVCWYVKVFYLRKKFVCYDIVQVYRGIKVEFTSTSIEYI
jgi:hypothetical protein